MHYTLHLTTSCNMNCSYCYSRPEKTTDMSEEILLQTIRYAVKESRHNCGIIFFGGEPLLKKDLIARALEECEKQHKENQFIYHTKLVTNGILLDEEYIKWATDLRLAIALSFDGIKEAHDRQRRTVSDDATFDKVDSIASVLLKYQPYTSVLMTVTPETVQYYHESVEYLIGKGFRYIIVSLNYAGNWTDAKLSILSKEYKKLAKLYEKLSVAGKKFYFSPFEVKLATHIKGDKVLCVKCALAQKQISVAPDGTLYPCVQFVGDGENGLDYAIGNVYQGIDESKRMHLYNESMGLNSECAECALKERCNNNCSCLNRQITGSITGISPLLCETERLIIPIVDKLGAKLYKNRVEAFLQKHYNPAYPYLSYMEEASCLV